MSHVSFTRVSRIGSLAALVLVGAALAAPQSSMASTVTFTAPTVTEDLSPAQVAAGSTTSVQITISDTVTSDILAGYGLDLFANTKAGNVINPTDFGANPGLLETSINFSGFSLSTTPAYVYNNTTGAAANANVNNSNDINFTAGAYLTNYTTSDGSSVANELYNGDTYANTDVASLNQTYGLATLDLTVAAGFTGTIYLVWNGDGQSTDSFAPFYELSGAPSNPLDPTLVPGSITIVKTPEPASVVMMVLGAVGLLGLGWRRTRRA